jgi:nitronate monooxygenase
VPRYGAAVPTSATTGRIDEMVMYCGESVGEISARLPARQIVANLTHS